MNIYERKVAPTHPGVILAEALEAMGLKIMPAAAILGTSRQMLHRIINGEASITPAMALRIGALCGNGPDLWVNMQTNHDLWHEARRMKREVAKIQREAVAYA